MDLLAQLNPAQREAVLHSEGPLLILAGAGSGKTRALAYRIAHLIRQRHVPPQRILAVTFTNKAAGEMRDRIESLVGGGMSRAIWVGTFHHICSRLLRRHGQEIGLDPRFVIYDQDDQRTTMRHCLKELGLAERRYSPGAILAAIGKAKNDGLDQAAHAQQATTFYEDLVARLWRCYQNRLWEQGALDFDDLLLGAVQVFRERPEVLATYQERFQHVLVDEYQDTNHIQYLLVSMLAARHRNLVVVGDDDQSIYRWRGADVRNILEFERDFPDARIVKLEQNYRSTQRILEAASEVIRRNPHRHAKTLWTENPPGQALVRFEAYDGHDEARYAAEEVRALHESGVPYRDVAILYRTNAQSRQFEEQFLKVGLPYQVVGGVRFYERREIKDVLAYLRVLYSPSDALSLRRIANVPLRGIGEVTLGRLDAYAQAHGVTLFGAMSDRQAIAELPPPQRRAIGEFAGLIERLRDKASRVPVSDLIEAVVEETGYRAALEAEGTDDATSRLENIAELVTVAHEFEHAALAFAESPIPSPQSPTGLEAFLEHLSLVTDVDQWQDKADRVTLMTLHSAKGLEFDAVFMAGMEEGLFPHSRAMEQDPDLEEERRLCYVGMTRAKRRLYLTYARQRVMYSTAVAGIPSRFLDEVPQAVLTQTATTRTALADWPEVQREVPVLAPGDVVRHRAFGTGRVMEVEGEGARAVVTVQFQGVGVKRLALGYAPLERVEA